MRDQSAELRNLVLRSGRQTRPAQGPPPRIIWLVGARREVRSSEVSVALAGLLAEQGYRTVLANASVSFQRLADLTGAKAGEEDWVLRRRGIHEVLQPCRPGLQMISSLGLPPTRVLTDESMSWLYRQFCSLRRHVDCLLIDGWPSHVDSARRLWAVTDDAVAVTTVDPVSVMDTYARVKLLVVRSREPRGWLLVHRSPTELLAQQVLARFADSCKRFLDFTVRPLGHLPRGGQAASPGGLGSPLQRVAARLLAAAAGEEPGVQQRAA